MADIHKSMYDRIFDLLKTDISLSPDPVPEENIRPEDDPTQLEDGPAITYSVVLAVDLKARRATGSANVRVSSADGKVEALSLMDKVRTRLTARLLTGDASQVRVHLFKERESSATDQGLDPTNRWSVATVFDLKAV